MLLAGAFGYGAPSVRMPVGSEQQHIALGGDVEAELGVEILSHADVRHDEMKTIERMDAKFARTSVRFDIAVNLGHCVSS